MPKGENPNSKKQLVPFKKGVVSNPTGRPKGSKNPMTRIKEILIAAFEENEIEFQAAIRAMAKADPVKFYERFLVPFVPKSLEVSGNLGLTPTDIETVRARIATLKEQCDEKTLTPSNPPLLPAQSTP